MDNVEVEKRINVINRDSGQYMMSAEKKCQKNKSGDRKSVV